MLDHENRVAAADVDHVRFLEFGFHFFHIHVLEYGKRNVRFDIENARIDLMEGVIIRHKIVTSRGDK